MSARKAAKAAAKPALAPRKAAAGADKPATAQERGKPVTPAAVPAPTGAASEAALELAAAIDRALANGETGLLSTEALQALMAALCRSYAAEIESGAGFPPLAARSRVTSTDVMVTASGLLKSANLAVFELGMWQSWTGR